MVTRNVDTRKRDESYGRQRVYRLSRSGSETDEVDRDKKWSIVDDNEVHQKKKRENHINLR